MAETPEIAQTKWQSLIPVSTEAAPDLFMTETPMDHYQMRIPAGTAIGGAVVELSVDERGIITAGLRIPGPPAP